MTHLLANAVRQTIKNGDWYANNDHTTEQQDDATEQRAFETELTDDEIIEAAKESQHTSLAKIAEWAMSVKIGDFVQLIQK
jgi:hypothetical protein